MARRTGVPTILAEAQQLQKHITTYTPVIQSIHPTNQDLITALADLAACLVPLIQEIAAVRELGD